jgi:hypothetical protein
MVKNLNSNKMEKQTKILLGLGAVIAAYLILKPKKVVAQTEVVTQNTKKVCPEGQELVSMTCIKAPCPDVCMPIQKPETEEEYQIRLNKEIEKLKLAAFKNRDCVTPMAIGYSSYFDEALGRCVTKYTKPTYGAEEALEMYQLGNLWA